MSWRKVSFYLLASAVGILCLLAILASTSWGTRSIVWVANHIEGLSIEYRSGSLVDKPEFASFQFDSVDMVIAATDLAIEIHLPCLVAKRVCIKSLRASSLDFTLTDEASTPDSIDAPSSPSPDNAQSEPNLPATNRAPSSEDSLVALPLSIRLNQLAVKQAAIVIYDINIEIENLTSALYINDSHFLIKKPTASRLQVVIPSSAESSSNDAVNDEWPLAALPEISLPLDLEVRELGVAAFQLAFGNQPMNFEQVQLSARWLRTKLGIKHFSTFAHDYGEASLSGNIALSHPYPLDLKMATHFSDFEQWLPLQTSEQKLTIAGDFTDLSVDLLSEGDLALTLAAQVNAVSPDLPFSVNLDATKLLLPAHIDTLVTPSQLQLDASGTQHVQSIYLKGLVNGYGYENAELEVQAEHQIGAVQIAGLSLLDTATQSDLRLSGSIGYDMPLSWDVDLESTGFTLPDINPELSGRLQGKLKTRGKWHDEHWQVRIEQSDIEGELNQIPVALQGDVELDHEGRLQPSQLQLSANNSELTIQGYSDENWHITGVAKVAEIGDWLPDSRGQVEATFSVSGALADPVMNFDTTLVDLYWQTLTSDQVKLTGRYQPNADHLTELQLSSDKLTADELALLDAKLHAKADLKQQSVTVSWQGQSSATIALEGQWLADEQRWLGILQQAELGYEAMQWQADRDVSIGIDSQSEQVSIGKHCWKGSGLDACMEQDLTIGKTGEVNLAITLDTAILDELLLSNNVLLETDIDGHVNIAWAENSQPTVAVALAVQAGHVDMVFAETDDRQNIMAWQSGVVNIDLIDDQAKVKLQLNQDPTTALIDIDGQIELTADPSMTAKVIINNIDLQPLESLSPELSKVTGIANANISLNGSLTDPVINGSLSVDNSSIKLLRSPSEIEALQLNLAFRGKQAELSGGFNLGEDSANLRGEVDWHEGLAADMYFSAEQLSVLIPPQVLVKAAPDLHAKLRNNDLTLNGKIDVIDGILKLVKLPEGSVGVSSDVVIVNDQGQPIEATSRFAIHTDIRVKIEPEFKVQGQGFNGNLSGELQIKQEQHKPVQLFGVVNIPEGRYRAYGQRLEIDKGVISFTGPANNPYVDLRAIRKIESEDVIAGIEVSGLANSLAIQFFSNPSMAESEVVSYLIRGRGTDAETNGGAAIGGALGSSLANASGVLEELEKLPLLNNLEVEADDTQASISGYVGDRVYLKYGQGIQEPINELTVRFYFWSRLWFETVSGLENSADIYYSFDIE